MAIEFPDPTEFAKREAQRIRENRAELVDGPVKRALADRSHIDSNSLLQGLEQFHEQRMAKEPSFTTYPEARPWVEHALAVETALRAEGVTLRELAVTRSLGHYLSFRGHIAARPANSERCRVVFDPQTDRGELHIKNVDDPDWFWKPGPPLSSSAPWQEPVEKFVMWDGVGSGLHIDDEPEEIFPLPIPQMYRHYADDVPSTVEFLTRYRPFWGGQNIVLHDAQQRSVAIEKCSYNHIEVFEPDSSGRSWCSGMVCRDPHSPQGQYQSAKRKQYSELFGLSENGPDHCFWEACDTAERMLAEHMRQPGQIKVDDVFRLFTTPFPQGLCKDGFKFHPDQAYVEYTLYTHATVSTPTRMTRYRWQRGPKPGLEWPAEPEVCISEKNG